MPMHLKNKLLHNSIDTYLHIKQKLKNPVLTCILLQKHLH